MTFPILSVIIFSPIVAAMIILLMPAERKTEIRVMALMTAIFALVLSFWVYLNYDQAAAGYQFIEKYDWMPQLGISLHLGVDGIITDRPDILNEGMEERAHAEE